MSKAGKVHGDGKFIPGSVRIVDYNTANKNILVRGSAAFGALNEDGTSFKISDLVTAIGNDSNFAATGITFDKNPNPMVIDFCLIGYGPGSKDEGIVTDEMGWFTTTTPSINGNSGPYPTYIPTDGTGSAAKGSTMIYWPIQSIGNTSLTTVGASIGNDTGFDFQGLITAIGNALQNQTAELPNFPVSITAIQDAIIYVHCDSGVNRTGAAVVGYLMRFGSNVAQMNLLPGVKPKFTLIEAQTAANSAPPSNDSLPAGGCDIPVAQVYCNLIWAPNNASSLVSECLPLNNS